MGWHTEKTVNWDEGEPKWAPKSASREPALQRGGLPGLKSSREAIFP